MAENGNTEVEQQVTEETTQDTEASEEPMETAEIYERTDNFDRFLGEGFSEKVAQELDKIHQRKLDGKDLDERALEAVKELDEETALSVLKHFCDCDLSHVQNKSAYLCGAIKMYRTKTKTGAKPEAEKMAGPDEAKIKELLERTGYSLDVTRSQRQYGGPPPDWEGDEKPPNGCEVFVKNIPKDWYEDKIVPLFEDCGKIYDIRLILDPNTGYNKGFCFVCYCDKNSAQEAIKKLHKHKANERFSLEVSLSYKMNTLYVGSIPKTKTKEEIKEEFQRITSGLRDVTLYLTDNKQRNRGFAFLEYEDHKSAALARKNLMNGKIFVFGRVNVTVDWADPIIEPDEEIMAKVKVVYIRGLTPEITEEKIQEKFKEFGEVEKVKKLKDYCFVNYVEREGAMNAIEQMNDQEWEGTKLTVVLAKPPQENKKKKERLARQQFNHGYSGYGDGYGDGYGGGREGMRGGMMGRGRGMGMPPPMRRPDSYYYDDYYYQNYSGGYGGDGYGYGYGGGYGSPGPRRGGPRGGRGGMKGGMQGTQQGFRGGRGGFRGGQRGANRGRGGGGNFRGKRKMEGQGPGDYKRRNTAGGWWGSAPIAQKPLGYGNEWASDDWQ